MINIVGIRSDVPSVTNVTGRWFDVIHPDQLHSPDLYRTQLKRRQR